MVAVRTEILDSATKDFIDKYPDAVILNLGCGLDTRFSRLDNGKIHWYDLDLPESISIRKQFFNEDERYKMIAKSVFDYSWIDNISLVDKPILIIVEGLLLYFSEQEVEELINRLIGAFKSAEMIFTMVPTSVVKKTNTHGVFGKMNAKFKWGLKNGREIEKFDAKIKFIEEWNYFNYHKPRWEKFGWLFLIPGFKNKFGNRIIHLKFN
jgi:O-methyltransferase involved in polyketide biosynthesis